MNRTGSTAARNAGATALAFLLGVVIAAVILPAGALAATVSPSGKRSVKAPGTLVQLPGKKGCLVDRTSPPGNCGSARALLEPGPFMGSDAIALSPDGRSLYVAAATSDAIAIFTRDRRRGTLRQQPGRRGCVATRGARGCATALGLDGPNSIAVSPDGRHVYATSRNSSSVTVFRRNRSNGALAQLPIGTSCSSSLGLPGCTTGRGLTGADVVKVSPDGANVYVGSFLGNSLAVFDRDQATGVLTQPADTTGCIAAATTAGCAPGLGLSAPEGMAISADGSNVYVASALANAVLSFQRSSVTGALSQTTDGSGCIVNAPLTGCTTGHELGGANAVAIGPDDKSVYVASLLSHSVTAFTRAGQSGGLAQLSGRAGCVKWLHSTDCRRGRDLRAPEGVAVSPDGHNVYAAAFSSDAIAVLKRNRPTGKVVQPSGRAGCIGSAASRTCSRARALDGVSSIVLSRDGRFLYSTSAKSNAVNIFRRR